MVRYAASLGPKDSFLFCLSSAEDFLPATEHYDFGTDLVPDTLALPWLFWSDDPRHVSSRKEGPELEEGGLHGCVCPQLLALQWTSPWYGSTWESTNLGSLQSTSPGWELHQVGPGDAQLYDCKGWEEIPSINCKDFRTFRKCHKKRTWRRSVLSHFPRLPEWGVRTYTWTSSLQRPTSWSPSPLWPRPLGHNRLPDGRTCHGLQGA